MIDEKIEALQSKPGKNADDGVRSEAEAFAAGFLCAIDILKRFNIVVSVDNFDVVALAQERYPPFSRAQGEKT